MSDALSNIYIPVLCALWGFSARKCSNGWGQDNAQAGSECIIRPRPLLHYPSALINWYIYNLVLLTYLKQSLV